MKFLEMRKRRKIRKALKLITRFLAKYKDRFDPGTLKSLQMQITDVENLMDGDSFEKLENKSQKLFQAFEKEKRKIKSQARELIEALIIALILALFIREFFVQAFKIPSRSMEDTLLVGDHILVWKCLYGIRLPFTKTNLVTFNEPERGDIIVFTPPHDESKDFIKRVIAVEGDTIEIRNDQVFVNGEQIDEPYIKSPNRAYAFAHYPLKTIEEDALFVMGDNRGDSFDSRGWGFLPVNRVKGRAFIIYLPWITSEEARKNGTSPFNLFARLRWSRFFHLIR
jgi:signal peptidase I